MKRNCGMNPCGGGHPTPYGMGSAKPNMVSPSMVSPNMVSPSMVSPNMVSPSMVSPNMVSPSMVSPAATGPLPAIVAPEQTVVKNFFHTATQPIVHPVNIVNQHHTIPVPQHFCSYNVKDVNCGVRSSTRSSKRKGRR